MRHPEPERVAMWRVAPKCCHTCEYYNKDGVCLEHKSEPPEDFAATDGACPQWSLAIPF